MKKCSGSLKKKRIVDKTYDGFSAAEAEPEPEIVVFRSTVKNIHSPGTLR